MNKKFSLEVPTPAVDRGKIAPSYLAHFVLKTPNFEKMVEWWCLVLEAKPSLNNGELAFLTYDSEHHRVAIAKMPMLLPNWRFVRGVDHVAFTYKSLADLFFTYERLSQLGISPVWCVNHGPTTSLYYLDPDKNQVELQVENFDDAKSLSDFSSSGEFEENPIGVDLSPGEILEKIKRSIPESEIKKRPHLGPRGLETVPTALMGRLHKVLLKIKNFVT